MYTGHSTVDSQARGSEFKSVLGEGVPELTDFTLWQAVSVHS